MFCFPSASTFRCRSCRCKLMLHRRRLKEVGQLLMRNHGTRGSCSNSSSSSSSSRHHLLRCHGALTRCTESRCCQDYRSCFIHCCDCIQLYCKLVLLHIQLLLLRAFHHQYSHPCHTYQHRNRWTAAAAPSSSMQIACVFCLATKRTHHFVKHFSVVPRILQPLLPPLAL